jgi:transketolase C-terminal domain/subunit
MTSVTDALPALPAEETRFLGELGQQLRADSIRRSTAAGSGHPNSAMSAAAQTIDLYSVKPLDRPTVPAAAAAARGRPVIAGDHYPAGRPRGAVLEALAGPGQPLRVRQCAVGSLPGFGAPEELMEAAGISASHITAAARTLGHRLKR